MRAVHLLRKLDPAAWSGTETAVQRLFEGLRERGVTPVAYCPRIERDEQQYDPLSSSGYEIQRFNAFVPVLGISDLRRRQLVSVGGNLMSFDLVSSLWRDKEASVIHTHTLGRIGGIARTIACRRQLPFVVSIHGGALDLPEKLKSSFEDACDGGWEWGKLFGFIFQSHNLFHDADAILACNDKEASLLRERYPAKRVVVQPHAVPLALYRHDHRDVAREMLPQIRGRKLLLCVGRIDPVKNQGWLLDQAPEIFRKHPQALLVLAGPCTDEAYGELITQKIRHLGLDQRVLVTGGFPADDERLIGLLQEAAAVLLPSISETFGLIILEAWAAGIPVLASRASGPCALVQSGSNGWLFDLDNPKTFHDTLAQTLANPTLARQMAQRGSKISERHDSAVLSGRVKALYEELIEEKQCVT
jgi:glycosyltransferase involved in cell wall biosynthesis